MTVLAVRSALEKLGLNGVVSAPNVVWFAADPPRIVSVAALALPNEISEASAAAAQ
jgi:hypothetical protein